MINNHNKDIFFNINITDTPMGVKGLCQEDEKVRSANVKVAAEGHSLADNERSPFSAFGNIEQFLCEDCLLIISLPSLKNTTLTWRLVHEFTSNLINPISLTTLPPKNPPGTPLHPPPPPLGVQPGLEDCMHR